MNPAFVFLLLVFLGAIIARILHLKKAHVRGKTAEYQWLYSCEKASRDLLLSRLKQLIASLQCEAVPVGDVFLANPTAVSIVQIPGFPVPLREPVKLRDDQRLLMKADVQREDLLDIHHDLDWLLYTWGAIDEKPSHKRRRILPIGGPMSAKRMLKLWPMEIAGERPRPYMLTSL